MTNYMNATAATTMQNHPALSSPQLQLLNCIVFVRQPSTAQYLPTRTAMGSQPACAENLKATRARQSTPALMCMAKVADARLWCFRLASAVPALAPLGETPPELVRANCE